MKNKLNLLFLTFLTLITKIRLEYTYCGVGNVTHEIIKLPESNKISKSLSDSEKNEYRPINISIDTTNLSKDFKDIIETSLKNCIQILKELIYVKPLNYKFFIDKETIQNWVTKINESITNSSEGLDTDLLVIVKSGKYYFTGNSDIKYMDSETKRPIVGIIEINTYLNFQYENGEQYIKNLLLKIKLLPLN